MECVREEWYIVMVAAVAVLEPLIAAKPAQAITVAIARPPRVAPSHL